MLTVKLPKKLKAKLEKVEKMHCSKIEDREDYYLAISRLKENNPCIPYELIRKELGLKKS